MQLFVKWLICQCLDIVNSLLRETATMDNTQYWHMGLTQLKFFTTMGVSVKEFVTFEKPSICSKTLGSRWLRQASSQFFFRNKTEHWWKEEIYQISMPLNLCFKIGNHDFTVSHKIFLNSVSSIFKQIFWLFPFGKTLMSPSFQRFLKSKTDQF